MKKCILGILAGLLCFGAVCFIGYQETHYTRKNCVVVETEGNSVTIQDEQGLKWEYEENDEIPTLGTILDVHMCTNGTDGTFNDDTVVSYEVTKTGMLLSFTDGTGYYYDFAE